MNSSNLIIREATYCMILYDYKWFSIEQNILAVISLFYDLLLRIIIDFLSIEQKIRSLVLTIYLTVLLIA